MYSRILMGNFSYDAIYIGMHGTMKNKDSTQIVMGVEEDGVAEVCIQRSVYRSGSGGDVCTSQCITKERLV